MAELRIEQKAQGAQIQNLQANVDVLYEKQCQVETMLKRLLEHHKLKFEDDQSNDQIWSSLYSILRCFG